jgi:integrase
MMRARNLNAVRNRARGTWVCFPMINGKRTTRTLGALNELNQEQANRKAGELLRNLKLVRRREVPTVEAVADQYRGEKLPTLRHSSQQAAESFLRCHVLPKWGSTPITELKPREVQLWLESLPLAGKTRGHLRGLLHGLFDFAMWSGAVAVAPNPISLVRVRGASKRQKQPRVLTPTEFRALSSRLAEPYRTAVSVQACLGLRVSELRALRWENVDWVGSRLTVENAIVGRYLGATKTEGSRRTMSLDSALLTRLTAWRQATQFRGDRDWIFASPAQLGRWPISYSGYRDVVREAAVSAGIGRVGTHVFRHSFRSWLDATGAEITVQRELMRHSDIRMTLNTYGAPITDAQRAAASRVAAFALEPDYRVITPSLSH